MTYLLVEDDCSPDSKEYFEKEMFARYGMTIEDFQKKGKKIEFGYTYNGYMLESFPEEPYWHLGVLVKPLKLIQTKLHTKTQKGNCFATVIACFLHKNVSDIPPFEELMDFNDINNTNWIRATNDYLHDQGWEWGSLDGHLYTDEFYLVTGKSVRGVSHCCIYQKGELYHDPHPDQSGLLSEDHFEYLSKLKL